MAVDLIFNAQGFVFQNRIKILNSSFNHAIDSLISDFDKIINAEKAYAESGDWIGELDDDGHTLWDQSQIFEFQKEDSELARMFLRKSFVIAAYHHWERGARLWTEKPKAKTHDDLVRFVQEKGYPIHPHLGAVRDLVNTLKHGNSYWGKALLKSWPEIFPPDFLVSDENNTEWYDVALLNDCDVQHVFTVVAESAPTVHS